MNKKMILGLGTSLLVASSLMAFNPQAKMNNGCKGAKSHKMMKKGMHHKRGGFIGMVMKLDLSDKQRTQIQSIVKSHMQNIANPDEAFTSSSFDKEKFIKLAKQRRNDMVASRADMMAKVYKVLDKTQKQDLKTMIDMKKLMKKRMMDRKLQNPPMPMRPM